MDETQRAIEEGIRRGIESAVRGPELIDWLMAVGDAGGRQLAAGRAVAGPAEHVLGPARRRFEGGDAVLDPLVVDGRDGSGIRGLPTTHDHARTVAAR